MVHGGVAMAQGGVNNDGNHNEEWERLKMVNIIISSYMCAMESSLLISAMTTASRVRCLILVIPNLTS